MEISNSLRAYSDKKRAVIDEVMKKCPQNFLWKASSCSGGGPLDTNQVEEEVDLINGIGWHTVIIILLPSDLWLEKFADAITSVKWNLELSVAHVVQWIFLGRPF